MLSETRWFGCAARVMSATLVAVLALAAANGETAEPMPLDEFSPAFLGMYRKVIEIEDEIRRHAQHYGVDSDLARAVCMYESGGNPGLTSHAGARGYFQVMPPTFRELGVASNIEAGVKYLSLMIQQFGREDRAVAAYNAGPGRIGRAGGLPLETLQYVIGVGHYRTVLKQYDPSLRHHASRLQLMTVREGDDWATIAGRAGIPAWELRLHNPFLAGRRLQVGQRIAYSPHSRGHLLEPSVGGAAYRMRHGDNYIKLAIMLGIEVESLRAENALWQTQVVPAGVVLRIPLSIDREKIIQAALSDHAPYPPTAPPAAGREAPVTADRGNAGARLRPVQNSAGPEVAAAASTTVRIPPPASATAGSGPRASSSYRVKAGDTLTGIARRYQTTVPALQQVNNLRGATIRVGQLLRIPAARPPV
jgi:LysM repeat protein